MTPEEYTNIIWTTYPMKDLTVNTLGLCGECGEFANKLKKRTYKTIPDSELIDELGDVLWHVAQIAHILGTDLESLMIQSAEKCVRRNK